MKPQPIVRRVESYSHQMLLERARPGPVDKPHRANITAESFSGPDRDRALWFWKRWDHARRCIADERWHGKVRCEPDITYEQEAGRDLEQSLCDEIDGQPHDLLDVWWFDMWIDRAIDMRLALKSPILGFFILWVFVGLRIRAVAAPTSGKLSHQGHLSAKSVALVADHIWIAKEVARKYRDQVEYDDLVQQGTFGLYKAARKYKPESGFKFSTLAYPAVEWAIKDYLDRLRRQQRHESSDELADKNEDVLGLYRSKSVDYDRSALREE
jgi:Sigma-70 region 2